MVLIRIAARNLLQAKRRTGLLGSAIALVTMMLVLLLATSRGIYENMIKGATNLSAGEVSVAGFYKVTPGSAAPILTGKTKLREIVEANTPGLSYVLERHRGFGKLVSDTGSVQAGLSGILAAEEERFFNTLQMAKESEYKEGGRDEVVGDPRRLAEHDTILLFVSQARDLGVTVGDRITIQTETLSGRSNTADVTVVAVARDLGLLSSFVAYVPNSTVLQLYQLDADTTGALWVYLEDIDDATDVMNHLREVFIKEGYRVMDHDPNPFFFKLEAVSGEDWTGQKLDLTIWRDEVSYLNWVLTGFDALTWFLTLILVLIIAVGIMNAMWQAVRERTREIGTMRAIGIRRSQALALFLWEALLLGLGATTIGAVLAVALALAVDAAHIPVTAEAVRAILLSDTLHLAPTPAAVLASIVSLTLFTAAAAAWPAYRASRLKVVDALAYAA